MPGPSVVRQQAPRRSPWRQSRSQCVLRLAQDVRAAALRGLLVALAVSRLTGAPAAAHTAVDLQLVLAVAASGSVSEERLELQKRGYVAAFRSPQLVRAIGSGPARAIAVTVVQWTGPTLQVQVVPWMIVNDEASMGRLAVAIAAAPRQLFGGG